jgi:hypothetical protein
MNTLQFQPSDTAQDLKLECTGFACQHMADPKVHTCIIRIGDAVVGSELECVNRRARVYEQHVVHKLFYFLNGT